jgi:phosphomannomutase
VPSRSEASTIRFGTDGWRGVIADDFTEANAAAVVQAAAAVWAEEEPRDSARLLVVGYDTRFNSRAVATLAGDILAANGWRVLLADRPVPTPVVSYAVTTRGAAGGLVVTASHNPARFNGIKLKGPFGGSATPEFTARVEAALGRTPPRRTPAPGGGVETVDLRPDYVARLRSRVAVDRPPARRLRILGDALHGATDGLLTVLVPVAWGEVRILHGAPDPLFGGLHPEPIPPHLDELVAAVRTSGADLGVALDGDGDRLGAVTAAGRYVTPHEVLTLLVRHLVHVRGWRGEVAKGFAMGTQVDRMCARLGLTLHVTPIGFKHIAALMRSRDILIGGEESGGIGVRDHLPERDGLLSALLVLEAVVASGRSLDALLQDLEAEAGAAAYRRCDYTLPPDRGRALVAALDAAPPERIGARPVTRCETLDGRKYWLGDGAWVLIRPSGTEPVLRVYVEAETASVVDRLHAAAKALVERHTSR